MKSRLLGPTLFGVLLLSTACTQIDAVQQTDIVSRAEVGAVPTSWRTTNLSGPVLNGWLAAYRDNTLTSLVNEAIAHNHDLRVAALNVERANTLVRQANAARQPTIGGTADAGLAGLFDGSANPNAYKIGVQAQWEIDVWGRLASGARSSIFQREAAQADFDYSQLSMASSVAKAYFGALEAKQQAFVARQLRDSLSDLRNVTQDQFNAGLASKKDISLTDADLAVADSNLIKAQGQVRQAARALQVLVGRYPSAELGLRNSQPRIPRRPAAGLPSVLLERRPDLRSAELAIASAFEGINQAQAARLPAFSLTENIAGGSTVLSQVLQTGNLGWTIAGNIVLPIFNAGALVAQVEEATIVQKQAVQQYASTALNAFQEVENQLDQGRVLAGQHNAIGRAQKDSTEALRLIRLSYKEGEVSLQDVLQVERTVYQISSSYQTLHRQRLDQFADLNVALGGDWNIPVPIITVAAN